MAVDDISQAGFSILPIGFSSHETATITSFFSLASHRAPHWRLTARSSEARVVLFNATSQQDMDVFKPLVASWQQVVVVGTSDFGSGWSVVPRPLKLTAILHLLDAMLKARAAAPVIVATPALEAPRVAVVTENKAAPIAPVDVVRNAPRQNAHDVLGRVLIVDDSDIALKYMQNRLHYFGYASELAKSGEEALSMIGKHSYQFVFLDVMMAGLDGYKTCRAIKNNKPHRSRAPVVVMLTSRGGTIDKIRGAMAGCDAYLTKPLNEKKLAVVLKKHDESTATQRWDAIHPRLPLADKLSV